MVKVCIFTSNHQRHRYFSREIAKSHDVVLIVSEEKLFNPVAHATNDNSLNIIKKHFYERDNQELIDFTENGFPETEILKVPCNSINKSKIFDTVKSKHFDYIIVFGTGIIGMDIIKEYPGKIINMHLGLSPFYKGSGTNFWPIVNNEPQYCGATIHLLDEGIDTGPILCRIRAIAKQTDSIHSFGNRIIKAGLNGLTDVIRNIHRYEPIIQVSDALFEKTYFRRDFDANAVKLANMHIKNGLLADYSKNQFEILPEVKILCN